MPNNNVKPPLGQVQERFDIKGGLSRKMASHQNEPNSWWNILNFRFYKENIFTFYRKAAYSVLAPTSQALTIPSQTCSVNSNVPIVPFGMWGYGQGGGPGGFEYAPPVIQDGSIVVYSGLPVTYQIVTDFPANSYSALSLPAGLTVDTGSGVISGTITDLVAATYTATIVANNLGGPSSATLTIQVKGYAEFTFTDVNGSGATYQLSIDGSPLLPLNFGVKYTAFKQMHFKVTYPNVLLTFAGSYDITCATQTRGGVSGDSSNVPANITMTFGGTIGINGASINQHLRPAQILTSGSTGTVSLSTNNSGSPILNNHVGGTPDFMFLQALGGDVTISSCVAETICTFI